MINHTQEVPFNDEKCLKTPDACRVELHMRAETTAQESAFTFSWRHRQQLELNQKKKREEKNKKSIESYQLLTCLRNKMKRKLLLYINYVNLLTINFPARLLPAPR